MIYFYPPLLDDDVSMHIVVGLVVVISTSPRTSKSESGFKSYGSFREAVFSQKLASGSTGKKCGSTGIAVVPPGKSAVVPGSR